MIVATILFVVMIRTLSEVQKKVPVQVSKSLNYEVFRENYHEDYCTGTTFKD